MPDNIGVHCPHPSPPPQAGEGNGFWVSFPRLRGKAGMGSLLRPLLAGLAVNHIVTFRRYFIRTIRRPSGNVLLSSRYATDAAVPQS